MSIRKLIVFAAALTLSAACTNGSRAAAADTEPSRRPPRRRGLYEQELEQWKVKRLASLKSEEGWLSLIGLFWFKEGENSFGSDPSNEIVLPEGKAPAQAGTIRLAGGKVTLEAKPGSGITSGGSPSPRSNSSPTRTASRPCSNSGR